ncbi:FAD-dependent monooxygenase [Micromonospora sp. NPDC018662]|uniref:FAD-dependent monooxygenase n=1 Tax=Micromonospora sp. NPDC018662 TaxID=3364238 RepID=UPI00379CD250
MTTRRALIVGGGPAGLATALALRDAGWTAEVVERSVDPSASGVALTLWPNALAALAALRADKPVREAGCPAEGNQIRAADGRVLDDVPGPVMAERFGGRGLALLRADLVAALRDQLSPGTLRTGVRCVGWTETGGRVRVDLSDGGTATVDLLVGADGIRSAVRRQLLGDGPDRLRYAGYPVWRGVARHDLGVAPGLLTMGRAAQFGLFPLTGGRAYWFATMPMRRGWGERVPRRVWSARFDGWHDPVPRVLAATPDEDIVVTDIYDRAPVPRWSAGRVVLVGDAAHPSTPNLGQGTCQALEDAVVLGRCLREHPVEQALPRYEAARRRRADGLTRQARMLGRVGTWGNPAACWLREQMIRRAPAGPRLRQMAEMFAFE